MSIKSPIFPMPEPQHFSDYGFDPRMDYFQVLEEARRQKREGARSIDSFHFKLQKPDSRYSNKPHNKNNKRWWKTALLFFKRGSTHNHHHRRHFTRGGREGVHNSRTNAFPGSIAGPVYITESRSGSSTPYRITTRTSSGQVDGVMSPVEIPYMSLRELSTEERFQQQRVSTSSAMPIYLVTCFIS